MHSNKGEHGAYATFEDAKVTADRVSAHYPGIEVAIFEKIAIVKTEVSPPIMIDCKTRSSLTERLNYPG